MATLQKLIVRTRPSWWMGTAILIYGVWLWIMNRDPSDVVVNRIVNHGMLLQFEGETRWRPFRKVIKNG